MTVELTTCVGVTMMAHCFLVQMISIYLSGIQKMGRENGEFVY